MSILLRALLITPVILLGACGGQDESGSAPPPSTDNGATDQSAIVLEVVGDTHVAAGDSIGLVVLASDRSTLRDVNWTFSDNIKPLAPHTQAVGFDAHAPGTISYRVTATTSNGETLSASGTLEIANTAASAVNARLTHQAVELGNVSLRTDLDQGLKPQKIEWQQTQGPDVELTTRRGAALSSDVFFQAPSVENDTLLAFTVHVTLEDTTTLTDNVWVVVNDTAIADDGYFPSSGIYPTTQMRAYRPQSPWSDALQACIYTPTLSQSCLFNRLPLLGQQTTAPTIADVMDRTLVSHEWMGDAFKAFLTHSEAGPDMLKLLRATTAIVISYDIRPSFYWSATGAIYLDADNVWLTPEQRDTINTQPDYRTEFDDDLSYQTSWRYVKAGDYYYPQPGLPRSERKSRTPKQREAALTWLLYHELAHANDVFPLSVWSTLALSDSPLRYANTHSKISDTLAEQYPLNSEILLGLARVSYGGAQSTLVQRNYTAEDVATEFEQDDAVSMYAYYTPREDFATLFERFMMQHRLNVDADVGIFSGQAGTAENLLLTWGQRNRINEQNLQPRAAFVVSSVLPNINAGQAQAAMPSPLMLPAGENWFDTLSIGINSPNAALKPKKMLRVTRSPVFERHLPLPAIHH